MVELFLIPQSKRYQSTRYWYLFTKVGNHRISQLSPRLFFSDPRTRINFSPFRTILGFFLLKTHHVVCSSSLLDQQLQDYATNSRKCVRITRAYLPRLRVLGLAVQQPKSRRSVQFWYQALDERGSQRHRTAIGPILYNGPIFSPSN